MQRMHVFSLGFLLALVIGYFVGVKWPSGGQTVLGKIGL